MVSCSRRAVSCSARSGIALGPCGVNPLSDLLDLVFEFPLFLEFRGDISVAGGGEAEELVLAFRGRRFFLSGFARFGDFLVIGVLRFVLIVLQLGDLAFFFEDRDLELFRLRRD
jgi:hypothetical protein